MKKFIQVFLSLASMSVIAGCACQNPYGKDSDDPQVLAIREDINNYMEDYGRSIEKSPCTYSSDNAKAVFEKIQVYQQQDELKNLSYEMVSQDKKTKITFIGDHLGCMKAVYKNQDNKIVRAVIVNGKRVFESKDGSVFEEIPVSSPVYREFQFIYAKNMKVVKSVKVAKLDEWLVPKRISDTETIQVLEAKEIYLNEGDKERVIHFKTVMKGFGFSVPVDMYFTVDPLNPMPKEWRIGQNSDNAKGIVSYKFPTENFKAVRNGDKVFTYAGVEIVNNGKDVTLFQIDKVLINQELPPQTFVPEKLLVLKQVQPEVKKPEVKKADPKKAEVKKPEVKKADPKKAEVKKPEVKK